MIKDTASRNLCRLMILTAWLSFVVSAWVVLLTGLYVWCAIFWLIMTLFLVTCLGENKKGL